VDVHQGKYPAGERAIVICQMIAMSKTGACVLGCFTVFAVQPSGAAEKVDRAVKRPATIIGTTPSGYFGVEPKVVRWGKQVRFQVDVRDPDENDFEVTADLRGDVAGATFDPSDRLFRWTPSETQRGPHEIQFTLSDGNVSKSRVARVTVIDNRPPEIRDEGSVHHATPGETIHINVTAWDPDDDVLSYRISDLPRGAKVSNAAGNAFEWTPSEDQIGMHTVHATVSDGTATVMREISILVEDDWSTIFLPGVYYSLWSPTARETMGTYQGVGMEIVPYAWIHRNTSRGPSHGKFTVRADILNSSRAGMGVALIYSVGFDLSIERNPDRTWLIPFFGLDTGGVLENRTGNQFQVSPHVGCYLWTHRNLYVSVAGSYQIVPSQLDTLSGWRLSAGLNLTLW